MLDKSAQNGSCVEHSASLLRELSVEALASRAQCCTLDTPIATAPTTYTQINQATVNEDHRAIWDFKEPFLMRCNELRAHERTLAVSPREAPPVQTSPEDSVVTLPSLFTHIMDSAGFAKTRMFRLHRLMGFQPTLLSL